MDYKNLNFASPKKLLSSLRMDLEFIESELLETKSSSLRIPSNKSKHTGYIVASNIIKGVINGIEERTIKKSEVERLLKQAYARAKVSFGLEIAQPQTTESSDDFEVEDDIKVAKKQKGVDTFVKDTDDEDHDDTQITHQLAELRNAKQKLPTKIKGTYAVARAPIIPIFENLALSNPEVMREAGFKTVHLSGKDLEGYVILSDQTVLVVDYAKYNKQYREEAEESYEIAEEKYKKSLASWKEQYNDWQEAEEVYQDAKEAYDKALLKVQAQLEAYDKYQSALVAYEKARSDYQDKLKLYKQGKAEKPVMPKPVAKVNKPKTLVKPEQPAPFKVPKPIRPKKPVDFNTEDLSTVVMAILDEVADNTNAEYTLMSDKPMRSLRMTTKGESIDSKSLGNNAGLIYFWIAEKWKYKNLERKFGRVVVENWAFPFN